MPTLTPQGNEEPQSAQQARSVEPLHPPRKRGRPKGSPSLTPKAEHTIIEALRAGVFANVAAALAGVSPRIFFEWIERGEGRHPTRSCTPKLKAFAREVAAAQAQARAYAEARVYREHPKYWLAHAARSKPGLEGWTDLKGEAVKNRSWIDRMLAEMDQHDATD